MITRKIITLLTFICCCVQLIHAQDIFDLVHQQITEDEIHEKLSVKELNDDIEYFVQTLEEVHISPFLNISKEQFFKEYNRIKNQITEPLTRKDFYRLITPLLSILMDSHTAIWFPEEMKGHYDRNNGKYIPFDVEISKEKLFVMKDYSKLNTAQKTEILAINNIPSNEIIKQITKHCFGFTDYSIQKQAEDDFKQLLWIAYDFEGPFTVKFSDGEKKVLGLTELELDSLQQQTSNEISTEEQEAYKKIDENIGLLRIESFYGFDVEEYDKVLVQQFSEIKADGVSNLIIDVRDNMGGNSMLAKRLIEYIWDKPFRMISHLEIKKSEQHEKLLKSILNDEQMQFMYGADYPNKAYGEVWIEREEETIPGNNPIRFKGNVFILINHNNYSSAVEFIAAIKDNNIGILIGEETGDPASAFGELYLFDLPNSHFLTFVSTKFTVRASGDRTMTRGVIPEHKVHQLKKDTDEGVDTVLKYTVDLIKNKFRMNVMQIKMLLCYLIEKIIII